MLLVHKKSRGILRGPRLPPGLKPEEWWQVRERTSLARRILRDYPCFDPVINQDGALLDIVRWGNARIKRVDHGGPADPKRDWRHVHDKKSRLYRRNGIACAEGVHHEN